MSTKIEATIEDLYRVPEHGKAEIVNGIAEAEPALPGWTMAVDEIFS
jgi:hypothetical protein